MSHRPIRRGVAATAAACAALVTAVAPASAAGLAVQDLDHGTTANQLAQLLAGSGVTISNVTYTGAPKAAGTFNGGSGIIGFSSGVVLGTGSVQTTGADSCSKGVEGPNQCDSNTTANGTAGDASLDLLAGVSTLDAAVLEFDFVPVAAHISFSYIFSSDEYPEFANSPFNDTFAFFVNGSNCALVPGTNQPVSVNTINGGNPLGTDPQHPELYVDNHVNDAGPSALDTEMDGLTTVLTCESDVTAGATNHMKLAIADGSDSSLDSNVFLKADSLVSGTQVTSTLAGGGQTGAAITVPSGTSVTDQATLSGANIGTASGTLTYAAYTDPACTTGEVGAGTKPVTNGSAGQSDALTLASGTWYWKVTYSGDPTHNGTAACDAVLTVTGAANVPPTITPASGSGVYSDPISPLTVTSGDADGDARSLTATGLPAGLTFTDNGNGTGTVSGTPTAVPASYPVTYTVDDGHNPPVSASGTITIGKEDCTLTTPPTITGTATAATTLTAALGESDATLGDRGDKTVSFAGQGAATGAVGPFTGTTGAGGNVSTSAALTGDVYSITASFAGDSYYKPCSSEPTIVTVAPAAFKVTGGGWITTSSFGRVSFGFNAMSDVAGLHGQIQVRSEGGKAKYHGNTVTQLEGTATTAHWKGTGSWNGVKGYTFEAWVVDVGSSGKKGDTVRLTITSPTGALVFSTGGTPVVLKGGNLTVHS